MPIRELLIVGLGFNVYWFLAVLGQSQFVWLLVILLLTSWWFYQGVWRFSLMLGACGVVMDVLLSQFGIFEFYGDAFPYWLVLLWLGFGSFVWIMRQVITTHSPYAMMLLGGVGGMMSYLAGYRLGAVMWPLGTEITAVCVLACWLCFSALALKLLNKYARQWQEEI